MKFWLSIAYAWICSTDMHGQLASGVRCLNCVMSVNLDQLLVCTNREDSGQCVHVCSYMRTPSRVFTARAHKECVHMCACKCAHMWTHSLYVRAAKTLASLRMRAHLHGLSYGNFNNQQYLMCYSILVSMRITPSWKGISFEFGSGRF